MRLKFIFTVIVVSACTISCKSTEKFDETQLQKGISLDAVNSSNNIYIMRDTVLILNDSIKK